MTQTRIDRLEKLLENEPDDTFCLYALAQEYAKVGDFARAIKWYDKTIAVDPQYLYAYFHKARALEALSQQDEARKVLNDGLARARSAGDVKAADEIEEFLSTLSA